MPDNRPRMPPRYQARVIRSLKTTTGDDQWIYNTACTDHMTGNFDIFQFYSEFLEPKPVSSINGTLYAQGYGTIVLSDENHHIHELHDVMYVPDLDDSIISKH